MPDETRELDAWLAPKDVEKTVLLAENLRLRHALTVALADYEMVNRVIDLFNIPMHSFTLTPQLIREALIEPARVIAESFAEVPPAEMDSGAAG